MKRWERLMESLPRLESKSQFIVAAVLLLLLPLLAVMQYRWQGQVSASERERMEATLRAAATRFSQDFDREITRAYTAFLLERLPGPFYSGDEEQSLTAVMYNQWLGSSSNPKLIKAVFEARPDEVGRFHLRRLKSDSGQFEPCEWPPEMEALSQRIEQYQTFIRRLSDLPPDPLSATSFDGLRPRRIQSPIQPLNADVPALVFPLIDLPRVDHQREFPLPRLSCFVILALDLAYIQQELLPALIKQHFVEGDRQSYDLAVVAGNTGQQVIWQSPAANSAVNGGWDFSRSDVNFNFFAIQIEEIRNRLRDRIQGMAPPGFGAPGARREIGSGRPGNGAARAFSTFRMMFTNAQQGIWDLRIRHRAGSLEMAVARAHHGNLIISFAILLMLAVSFLLLMISSSRARRLAQQQMDFVAGISHELCTPLAVIDSAGYNLTKGFIRDSEAMKEYGSLIRTECSRLGEMVKQALEFASMRSGRQRYDLLPVSVNEVIDNALTSSQPLLVEGGFKVEKEISANLPEVMADRKALVRALQNLLSNAMKYGGENRWIGVKAAVTGAAGREFVKISINDRGAGIAADDLPHVFEAFYRSRKVRASQIQGNGLGLSLVKNIIAAHGGTIEVNSKPSEGSSFTLIIPTVSQPSNLSKGWQTGLIRNGQ
jgi:signal transduction histidine kinase